MNIFIGGNPLTKKDDNTVIYTQPKFMPPLTSLESFPNIKKSDLPYFIENLYFLTMEGNGFSYFYPNTETGINLCRFEWHYEHKNNPYELRVGISFKVLKGSLNDIGFYIVPHAHYGDLEKERDSYELEDEEYNKIIDNINYKIEQALLRVKTQPKKMFNILYYVQLGTVVTDLIEVSPTMYLLPSRIVDGKVVSAVVIKGVGHSYLSAKRFSDEKVNFLCAVMTLVVYGAKVTHIERYPSHITPADKHFDLTKENIDKFYPDTDTRISDSNCLTDENIEFISSLLASFDMLPSAKDKRKILNMLFSFYSAKETEGINQTVGLVSYVACLDAIAKELFSAYRDEHGSRKALVHAIVELLCKSEEESDIDKWSKRIYNDHRSSYVHGANIRFEAFSQNMDGKNFAGLPKALPTEVKPVSKQYEYNSDYMILKKVTLAVLVSYIESVTGDSLPHVISNEEVTFKTESTPEAHVSMPNNGWVRLT
ncbi:hypothetical protein AOR11_23465 [Vibrio alginolyticus]|uniref:hypothetical protein n=1 Tax=Vibrio alginolyticus TaxID=663 RepID=UPI0006CA7BDB|nr:hypothetical protein [Vibrio alginolyticus]KPM99338.1 hypothetical protein AOR11_23465 [Vibrio alginolyticus]